MRSRKRTYGWMICLLAGWLLCGCSNMEEELVSASDSHGQQLNLHITLNLDYASLAGYTRTKQGVDIEGTTGESTINSLTLFITNIEAAGETVEGHKTISNPDITQEIVFDITGTKGNKSFYLVANMNEQQIKSFTGDRSEYILPLSDLSTGYGNTHNIMDINYADKGQGSNILMTARITHNKGNKVFSIDQGEIYIDTPVKLERTVSKVLLTCKTNASDYLQVKDNIGWAKLEDVRYMGNLFNRKLYLFPQNDPDKTATPDPKKSILKDANYEMSLFLNKKGNIPKEKEAFYRDNFQFYDAFQQVVKLKANDCKPYHKAVKYDAARLNVTSANRYTEGLFYPANRVKKDIDFEAMASYTLEETFMIATRRVTTHLLVAVRFVPKKIWFDDLGALKEFTASSENEMLTSYLKEVKEILSGEEYTHPSGTYWYYKGQFYSYNGMLQFLKENPSVNRSEMERFDGGWGYYFSFIDGNVKKGVIDYQGEDAWGIVRNHYYILNVIQLTPPGSSIPGNKMMKIPTEKVEWIDKGGSEINVVP